MNFSNLIQAILRTLRPSQGILDDELFQQQSSKEIQHPPQDVLDSYQHQRALWRSVEVDWANFLSEASALANSYFKEDDEEFEYRLIRACVKDYRYQNELTAGENVFQFLLYLRISFRRSVQENTAWQGFAFSLQSYLNELEEQFKTPYLIDRKAATYKIYIITDDQTLAERLLDYFPEEYDVFSEPLFELSNVKNVVSGQPSEIIDPVNKWDICLGYTHTMRPAYRLNYKTLTSYKEEGEDTGEQGDVYAVHLQMTGGRYAWNRQLFKYWIDWVKHIDGIDAIKVTASFYGLNTSANFLLHKKALSYEIGLSGGSKKKGTCQYDEFKDDTALLDHILNGV